MHLTSDQYLIKLWILKRPIILFVGVAHDQSHEAGVAKLSRCCVAATTHHA